MKTTGTIKAVIIDDEQHCCDVLATLLEKYCPEVRVLSSCTSEAEGVKAIEALQPSLLFLDVEMPRMNGFQLLERLPEINFDLVFTTSYDQYALKAFKVSALDYLLKPIDREELMKAVRRVAERNTGPLAQQLEILLQKVKPSSAISKIALPTMEGLQLVVIDSIVSCQSDSNYTVVLLKDKQKILVSRTLKDVEGLLEDHPFARVHHSHLVNLNEIEKYVKGEGGYLVMSDGSTVDVSRSRKEFLLKKLLPDRK